MKRFLVLCAVLCAGFVFAPDVAMAQECHNRFVSCVQQPGANRAQCEEQWRGCMQKCAIVGPVCNPDPECQRHCTENSCPQMGSTDPHTVCCAPNELVGPLIANPCPDKICGNCRPKQEQGGQGGKPPELPKPPPGGEGGQPPTEMPRTDCETQTSFLGTECHATSSPQLTLVFTADPSAIVRGASSTLSWVATNAILCTASNGWSGTKAATGTQEVAPTVTTTYTLICSDEGKEVSESTRVVVRATSSSATNSIQALTERITQILLRLTGQESDEEIDEEDIHEYFLFFPFLGQEPEGTIRHRFFGVEQEDREEGRDRRFEQQSFIDTFREPSTFIIGIPRQDTSDGERFTERFWSRFRGFLARWGF